MPDQSDCDGYVDYVLAQYKAEQTCSMLGRWCPICFVQRWLEKRSRR